MEINKIKCGKFSFNVPNFDLKLTMFSGQTSQPPWKHKNDYYQELIFIEDKPCLIKVRQKNNHLEVKYETDTKVSPQDIKKTIKYIFDLEFNLDKFYFNFTQNDSIFSRIVEKYNGLRLFLAHNKYECIISSITSANNSISKWTRSILRIKEKLGRKYVFPSSEEMYYFPDPETVLENKDKLKYCGVGYRYKYIVETTKILYENLSIDEVNKMEYDEAFETLLELPGVGPKVADCILLYGFRRYEAFPVDIWITRAIKDLFGVSKDIREFGQSKFGKYAGYAQLYLYQYIRHKK
ncbi:DNA-(apurinic or apyrimidinic site) lyase [Methanothermus fervidus DSM 2088]|uniref:DNA-(apurinic or apyrimidinic site) lyase n=1 Tax=Methanothermus fervidus (strain ATCC 43054 / DSM 2088 / JCM 10308 / V24 S) TaxID=523846 RepID=E3GWY5_METFV|nr:DNA glycosylase [Methanothermus fervidus]ADP76874.1 DNA-(apurinic or apyrimidinic site) lyase [Methanothermus fervidus DSM 2088]